MPKNTNILMIRHAEKPDSGSDLAVAGQERAQAYVAYFRNYSINSSLVKLDYLFAAANSSASQRPQLTIQPLAAALGLPINDKYEDKDYQKAADYILQNPKYDQKNLLICWHHGEVLDLAEALGATGLPSASNWPAKPWPGKVFGWLLQLCYDDKGAIIPAQTICINQELMFGDHGKNPPACAS
jgi:broad specificity phosphatase PhoE